MMLLRAIALALEKEVRLLWRDKVGLFMLFLAPVVVIAVAGLSLANLYGADPSGQTAYLLPVVDEDHGEVARAVLDALQHEPAVRLKLVAERGEAESLVRDRNRAGVAVVIPPGTSAALEAGGEPRLIVFTDPVKYLEITNVALRLNQLCSRISATAASRARERIADAHRKLRLELEAAAGSADKARLELEQAAASVRLEQEAAIATLRRQLEAAIAQAQEQVRGQLSGALEKAVDTLNQQIAAKAARQEQQLEPLKQYLEQLRTKQNEFEAWFAELKKLAGSRADSIPAPPTFPTLPPELDFNLRPPTIDLPALQARLQSALHLPPPKVEVPQPPSAKLPAIPKLDLTLTSSAPPQLPGTLGLEERNLTGISRRINTFDQNVPGFGVTFVLIGMLMGISLGLIDEREWGTLERLRVASAPFAGTLIGKLLSRFLTGLAQLIVLFAIGKAAFGISLGVTPLALLMPAASIAFAGAAFGLLVAGVAKTRDAVLPVGAIVIMTMAAVGGCWWPIDLEPAWMRNVALALPTTWAMQGFNDLMLRHLPASSALVPAAVTGVFGLLYLMVGTLTVGRALARR